MKYVDTEKLKAEIEKRAKFHNDAMKACIGLNSIAITHSAGWKEDTELLTIIDSLQQEQPEVNLEKEIQRYLCEECSSDDEPTIAEIARHFYELGKKGGNK